MQLLGPSEVMGLAPPLYIKRMSKTDERDRRWIFHQVISYDLRNLLITTIDWQPGRRKTNKEEQQIVIPPILACEGSEGFDIKLLSEGVA